MSYSRVTGITSIFDANRPIYDSLGNPITGAKTSAEAIKLAGLDWNIEQKPVQVAGGAVIDGYVANVRSDTQDVMGIVTPRYKPVQNADAFAFTDALLGNGVHYETAGCLKDGKRVWMLAKIEDHNDYKLAGDEVIPYLLFSNNHDGKGSVQVALTLTRVWCQNTLNMALKNAKRTWSVCHSGNIEYKMEEARRTLELTGRYLATMQEEADKMTQTIIHPAFMEQMVKYLFPIDESTMSNRTIDNANNNRNLMLDIYNNKEDVQKFKGTAWGAYLAITDFNSHAKPARLTTTANENKFLSMCDGSANDLATKATEYLMANVG